MYVLADITPHIYHMTNDEMAFPEDISSDWQPCMFSVEMKLLFKRNEDISSCFMRQKNSKIFGVF